MPVAIVTGASAGLGRAVARSLADHGWRLVIDARGVDELLRAAAELSPLTAVVALPGDVADGRHLVELAGAADRLGGPDVLVNNASALGPSPLPALADYPLDALRRVYEVDVLAPLALTQLVLPRLTQDQGVVVNVSSDAAVEAYPDWG